MYVRVGSDDACVPRLMCVSRIECDSCQILSASGGSKAVGASCQDETQNQASKEQQECKQSDQYMCHGMLTWHAQQQQKWRASLYLHSLRRR